jgi:hypothetical protein
MSRICTVRSQRCRPGPRFRRGAILVKVALLMPILIGMLGLVIDAGLLMAAQRQAQNAADAAALAAAMDRVRGRPDADAQATADDFIERHASGVTAMPLVRGETFNIPPYDGAYAGDDRFVEVIAELRVETLFIHVLGVARDRMVRARAVAGYEAVAAGEGVMVMDRLASPGLSAKGNAWIRVNGRITVNSEAEEAALAGKEGIHGTEIAVVGGVDNPDNFYNIIPGGPNPLLLGELPEPDPLLNLVTPMIGNGVDHTRRGTARITNNNSTFIGDEGGLNFRAEGGEILAGGLYTASQGDSIFHPGIYSDIDIQGGNVIFLPGIYILRPTDNSDNLKITGGTVTGRGILVYITGSDYDPVTGLPDRSDHDQPPPAPGGPKFASVSINAAAELTPIDTQQYNYPNAYAGATSVSDAFNGMLFYQRRRNTSSVTLTGNSASGGLTGTLYAKWAQFKITGQGSFDAQFLCGSIEASGQGRVTILAGGSARGKANRVFLVE